jgi:hypothetical protein
MHWDSVIDVFKGNALRRRSAWSLEGKGVAQTRSGDDRDLCKPTRMLA